MASSWELSISKAERGKVIVRGIFGARHDWHKLSPSVISSPSVRELDQHKKTPNFLGYTDTSSRDAGQLYGGLQFVAYSDHSLVWNPNFRLLQDGGAVAIFSCMEILRY